MINNQKPQLMKTPKLLRYTALSVVCLTAIARGNEIIATVPSEIVTEPGDFAYFNYAIPAHSTITSADLQLNDIYAEYNNRDVMSYANLYINNDFLGEFLVNYPGVNLNINIPTADLASLLAGSADVSFSIPTGEYFSGDPGMQINGGTLAISVPERASTAVTLSLMLPLAGVFLRRASWTGRFCGNSIGCNL
jgi:hypothetical protein